MNKVLLFIALVVGQYAGAEPLTLDQLLQKVKQTQGVEGKINRQREQKFLAEKNKQKELLAAAKAELGKQKKINEQIKAQLEQNESDLAVMDEQLKERSGILRELFSVARQASVDLKADLEHSIISAQYPERLQQLEAISNSEALPTIEQLETLWYILQHEMTEAGKIVRFNSDVQISGENKSVDVIRAGSFNAISQGNYLKYDIATNKLVQLPRQPDADYLQIAEQYGNTRSGMADLPVDPTRGVMLSLLIQTPDTLERIQQGGIIGYIILFMGALGVIYAILRFILLTVVDNKMKQQIQNLQTASDDNPLGRVLSAAQASENKDMETLELVLDEAITREVPALESGLSMIKLLAAVAPLLGLLGTVTGMIATFQSISLFGTGDPKLMASGISQALVTTMLGLIVAIPLLFIHSLVASRSKRLVQILDEQTAGLITRQTER